MNKKYLFLLFLAACQYACSSDSPDMPDPKPEEENTEPKPDEKPGEDDKTKPDEAGTSYVFPKEFTDDLVGQEITVKNELVVVRTYGDRLEGKITLAPSLLRTPTDVEMPGSTAFKERETLNKQSKLAVVANGMNLLDPTVKTLRVGTKLKDVKGKVSKDAGRYMLTLTATPTVEHVKRLSFAETQEGAVNSAVVRNMLRSSSDFISVVSMNLEYYMASPSKWGHSNGAHSAEEFERQNTKIVAAMKEMRADVFAICEIEEGNYSPAYLTEQLNKALGTTAYKYVDSGDTKISSYTKNTFIYNAEVVSPFKECRTYSDSYLKLRHLNQCFERKGTGEKFILSVNHFKSKSGKASGNEQDKHDGQGSFNARRVKEARSCLKTYQDLTTYYQDTDVLVVGDLNSYSQEDPIRVFTDAGYTEELVKHSPQSWSYVYDGQVGYLDHILSSASMSKQVVNAFTWDVNASEPSGIGYKFPAIFQQDVFRYSDHNPVIVHLRLK